MKKILISGCSGFLASYLIDRLETEGTFDIHGFTEVADFRSSRQTVHHVDIRDKDRVSRLVEQVKPDLVYHLAAVTNVGFSWSHRQLTYDINFIGSSHLLESLNTVAPGCRVLLMSTAELYGAAARLGLDESTPLSARNPYALSKWAMEMEADLYCRPTDIKIIKLRSFNFTGPGQDRKFVASDFSHQIAEIEKGEKEPILRVGNLSAVRDISDVRDVARYLTAIARDGQPGSVYNLCSGRTYSIQQLLDILLSLSSREIKVETEASRFRPIDVPVLGGDNRRLRETLGLEPSFDVQQTLADLLNYWRDRV